MILLYFFGASGLLILKLNPGDTHVLNLGNAYAWTLFGGIEGTDFTKFEYAGIAITFGTVMVTIVLLNVLIAYLSNLFSRLEDQQKSNDLKEKASMILDLEIIVFFFRYVLTGKKSKYLAYSVMKENAFELAIDPNSQNRVKVLFFVDF